jgi:hypothetical protein
MKHNFLVNTDALKEQMTSSEHDPFTRKSGFTRVRIHLFSNPLFLCFQMVTKKRTNPNAPNTDGGADVKPEMGTVITKIEHDMKVSITSARLF